MTDRTGITDRPAPVLYILSPQHIDPPIDRLVAVQILAEKTTSPLAVIYPMADWDEAVLQQLRPLESRLAAVNIPLLVLVGDPQGTLAGLYHHLKPLRIINHQTDLQTNIQKNLPAATDLHAHAFTWPGRVITISQLITLHAAGQLAC